MPFDEKALKELVKGKTKEEILGENGLIKSFVKSMVEAALKAELDTHLGYEKHAKENKECENSRNGYGRKTIKGEFGETEIEIPRDREGTFEPLLVQKRQTRFDSFDSKIIAMYARGMSTRDIQASLQEMYGVEVSPVLISNVTDAVIDDVKAWQSRPLDSVYPIVYLDAIVMKVTENKRVINKAVYLALGVNTSGHKEILGLWISPQEGAKFWFQVLTELNNRGVKDILIACVDGLTGFPEAISAVFPQTQVQLCIVHMVRNSLKFVGWNQRKELAGDLKAIYGSATIDEAEIRLDEFAAKWDAQFPTISASWRRHWENVIPFFNYPQEIRKVIYTTNSIESLNMTIRKVTKNKRIFPNDEAMTKSIYLALQNIAKKWTMPIRNWGTALSRFMIEFEGRIAA
jgi:putative transposase